MKSNVIFIFIFIFFSCRLQADKSTIVDEAVNYIKNLQQTLHKLQKQKLEKLQTATTAFTYEPTTTTPQRLVSYDIQSSREAFLADQGSCSTDLASATTTTPTTTNHHVVVDPISTTSHSPVIFQTWTSSNVVLNICGEEAHISVCSPKKPGLFSTICYILEKHKISVVSAHISTDSNRNMYMIQAHYVSFFLSPIFYLHFQTSLKILQNRRYTSSCIYNCWTQDILSFLIS